MQIRVSNWNTIGKHLGAESSLYSWLRIYSILDYAVATLTFLWAFSIFAYQFWFLKIVTWLNRILSLWRCIVQSLVFGSFSFMFVKYLFYTTCFSEFLTLVITFLGASCYYLFGVCVNIIYKSQDVAYFYFRH